METSTIIDGGTSFVIDSEKKTITIYVKTADGSSVKAEGCTETVIESGTESTLNIKSSLIILKGNIIEFNCGGDPYTYGNQIKSLNVQGLKNLEKLNCSGNRLK